MANCCVAAKVNFLSEVNKVNRPSIAPDTYAIENTLHFKPEHRKTASKA